MTQDITHIMATGLLRKSWKQGSWPQRSREPTGRFTIPPLASANIKAASTPSSNKTEDLSVPIDLAEVKSFVR